jgi:regulator of sigma E protease
MIMSFFALAILILLHEAGHFFAARWFHIPVPEFSIGFGARIFGWKRNGTTYTLRAIPLGGYIKTDDLSGRPVRQRVLVALAGPAANLLFAYLVFTFTSFVGVPQLTTRIGTVFAGHPAAAAGIQPGDRVTSVNGKHVTTWTEMITLIDQGRDREVKLTVETEQRDRFISLKPEIREGRGVIGVKADGETTSTSSGANAPQEGWRLTWGNLKSSSGMFLSLVSFKNFNKLGGPLYIAKAGAEQSHLGIIPLLYFMAIISSNLVTLNLLPIPILDGGLVLLAAWEGIFRKPFNATFARVLTGLSLGLMVSLALFALINDIARMIKPS